MYLSATPISFSHASVISVVTRIPQMPNSSRVRNAAMITRRRKPSAARPTWKPELMIVPRAACWRRLRPWRSMRPSSRLRCSVAIAAIFTESGRAATQPAERVMREQEALVSLLVVLELRVAGEELAVRGERARAAVGEHRQLVDDPVLAEQQAAGCHQRRVQLELPGHVVTVMEAVEDHHHRPVRLGGAGAH